MKKIVSILLIGMMTAGCGKTARLAGIEREAQIAAEARLADIAEQTRLEAVRLANRSSWEKFKDGFWKHSVGYSMLIFTAVAAGTYHFCYRKPKPLEKKQENEHPEKQPNFAADTVQTGLPVDVPKVVENTQTQTEIIPEKITDFVNQLPVNHPWQPNSGVFNEPFIQYYEKTFKQKPIPMLTYDPKPETQVEGLQNVNAKQQIDIQQQVAEYALMEANNTEPEPIIVEVPRVLGNARTPTPARDPLLDEALFAIYGDERGPCSRYSMDTIIATMIYAWVWQNADRPGTRFVPWLRYTQAIWEVAIERCDQRRLHGNPLPPRPVPPWGLKV